MESLSIVECFARASRLNESRMGYLTERELAEKRKMNGAKRFKRMALGLCGLSSDRSLEEMAYLLNETGVVDSLQEGREMVPSLVGKSIEYKKDGILAPCGTLLGFDLVKNADGQNVYRVYVHSDDVFD